MVLLYGAQVPRSAVARALGLHTPIRVYAPAVDGAGRRKIPHVCFPAESCTFCTWRNVCFPAPVLGGPGRVWSVAGPALRSVSPVRLWSGSLVCGRVSCPSVVRVPGLWLACGGVSGRVRLSDWSCLGGPGLWSVVAGSRRPRTLKKKVHGVFFYDRRRLRPLGGSGWFTGLMPERRRRKPFTGRCLVIWGVFGKSPKPRFLGSFIRRHLIDTLRYCVFSKVAPLKVLLLHIHLLNAIRSDSRRLTPTHDGLTPVTFTVFLCVLDPGLTPTHAALTPTHAGPIKSDACGIYI